MRTGSRAKGAGSRGESVHGTLLPIQARTLEAGKVACRAQSSSLLPAPCSLLQSGFTLLEILLALVLMSLAMIGVWGALRTSTRLTRSADVLIAHSDRTRAVQQFLRAYLGGAQPQAFVQKPDSPAQMFEGEAQQLSYVAPMPAQLGDGGLFVQTLQLVHDHDDSDYTLQLTYAPLSNDKPATASKPEMLLEHVAGGGFQYLVTAGNDKPAQWRDEWKQASGLPLAVRVTLQPAWRDRVGFPAMTIPLRAGNGSGIPISLGSGR